MLSFDPDKPFAGVNFGLDNAFAAQQNQAQQALEMTDEQFKLINQLQDPKTSLAYRQAAANSAGNVPQLRFGGESFAEGLGNGINNYYAMKGYKQREQTYKDIATQQQAYQQKQLEIANNQMRAQRTREIATLNWLKENRPDIARVYELSDPAGRNAIMTGISTREIGTTYKPLEGTAEGLAQVNKGTAINTAVSGMPPVERNGIPIPQQIDARRNIQGFAPTTTVDVNQGVIANQQAAAGLQKTTNELSVQPVQLQQEVELKKLQIAKAQVDAQFAEQEKILTIKREQLAHKQGTLDYQKGLEEYKRFQQGQQLYKQLQDSGALDSNDPAKQAQAQAQLGIYGIKYNPPSSSFQTVKRKDGTIYMLDKNTGQLGKLEKDGTVKTWQDLQL